MRMKGSKHSGDISEIGAVGLCDLLRAGGNEKESQDF